MSRIKRGVPRRVWIIAGFIVVVVVVATGIWFSTRPTPPGDATHEQSAAPTTASATEIPSAAEIDELNDRLVSGDRTELSTALGLAHGDVTDEMTAGFSALDIAWDTTALESAGDSAWVIPASVKQLDGTATRWIVTLVRSRDGLVFLDSQEVAP